MIAVLAICGSDVVGGLERLEVVIEQLHDVVDRGDAGSGFRGEFAQVLGGLLVADGAGEQVGELVVDARAGEEVVRGVGLRSRYR